MKNCIIIQEGAAVSIGTASVIIQQKILRLKSDIYNKSGPSELSLSLASVKLFFANVKSITRILLSPKA